MFKQIRNNVSKIEQSMLSDARTFAYTGIHLQLLLKMGKTGLDKQELRDAIWQLSPCLQTSMLRLIAKDKGII